MIMDEENTKNRDLANDLFKYLSETTEAFIKLNDGKETSDYFEIILFSSLSYVAKNIYFFSQSLKYPENKKEFIKKWINLFPVYLSELFEEELQ